MVSLCCHAPVDYLYATWYACRACGQWFEEQPFLLPTGGVAALITLPMHFEVYPRRGHAMGAVLNGGEPEPIVPMTEPPA